MSISTAISIAEGLNKFSGRVGLSGSGEPLLNTRLLDIVSILKTQINGEFELLTNGDMLTEQFIKDIMKAGITKIVVSMHDGKEQIATLSDLFERAGTKEYVLRTHWDRQPTFNNRCGNSYMAFNTPVKRVCNLPFYKMRIDANGDVGLCCQDWGRTVTLGNVNYQDLMDLWLSDGLNEYRKHLLQGDRSKSPCDVCDVIGDLSGDESVAAFKEYLGE